MTTKKNPKAVAAGHARAAVLSPERRREIARTAAVTRWKNEVRVTRKTSQSIARERLVANLLLALRMTNVDMRHDTDPAPMPNNHDLSERIRLSYRLGYIAGTLKHTLALLGEKP